MFSIPLTDYNYVVQSKLLICLGTVKKCGLFKILHEKYKQTGKSKTASEIVEFQQSLKEATELYPEIGPHVSKAQVYLYCTCSACLTMYSYALVCDDQTFRFISIRKS